MVNYHPFPGYKHVEAMSVESDGNVKVTEASQASSGREYWEESLQVSSKGEIEETISRATEVVAFSYVVVKK